MAVASTCSDSMFASIIILFGDDRISSTEFYNQININVIDE
jgi:hypothetical protein